MASVVTEEREKLMFLLLLCALPIQPDGMGELLLPLTTYKQGGVDIPASQIRKNNPSILQPPGPLCLISWGPKKYDLDYKGAMACRERGKHEKCACILIKRISFSIRHWQYSRPPLLGRWLGSAFALIGPRARRPVRRHLLTESTVQVSCREIHRPDATAIVLAIASLTAGGGVIFSCQGCCSWSCRGSIGKCSCLLTPRPVTALTGVRN